MIQDTVKFKFILQCEYFGLCELYNVSDSGSCERLVHFIMSVIQAHVNI